ncbi:MAG: hypothetical protein FWG72_09200 [Oscillospiraceae bacterium]|nr:hypothetical protein [Oscillospiraceae bacterium]
MTALETFRARKREIEEEYPGRSMYSHEEIQSLTEFEIRQIARDKLTALGLYDSIMYMEVCFLEKSAEAQEQARKSYGREQERNLDLSITFRRKAKALNSTFNLLQGFIEEARNNGLW